MQPVKYIKDKLPLFIALGFTSILLSCGSYQYVGNDNDGIYGEQEVVYEENQPVTTTTNDNNVYKDYFTEKELQYGEIPIDENAVFTDIDSYSSTYADESTSEGDQTGQAGWGAANDNVTINFYNNGWNNWGWGRFGYGWYDAYWGYPYGWNRPWAWGWNNWGWNYGYGWGWNTGFGFNNGWCPPGYYYGNNLIRNNRIAYHYGRRGATLNRSSLSRRSFTNLSRRNSTTYRNRSTLRSRSLNTRNTRSSIRPRTTTRSRARANSTMRPRTTTTRSRSNSSMRSRSNSSRSSISTSRGGRSSSGSSMRSSSSGSSRSSGSRSGGSSGRRR